MTIATITPEYQLLLELHRMYPDDEQLWEHLQRARKELELAWWRYRWTL